MYFVHQHKTNFGNNLVYVATNINIQQLFFKYYNISLIRKITENNYEPKQNQINEKFSVQNKLIYCVVKDQNIYLLIEMMYYHPSFNTNNE